MVGMIKGCFGGGEELPSLSNPATAADVRYGKEFIDGSGNKTTGSAPEITGGNVNLAGQDITLAGGSFLLANKVLKWDNDIVSGNIKSGVNIFGVEGTFSGDVAIGTFQVSSAAASYTLTGFGNFTPRYFAAVIQGIGENELYDAAACLIYGPSYRRMGKLIDSNWEFRPSSLSSSAVSFDEGEVSIDLGSNYLLPGTYVYLVAG